MTALPEPKPREPQFIYAGDYVQWTRSSDDFPAGSWTLNYVLRGPQVYTFASTAQGSDFLITLAGTVTAAWKPGWYLVEAYVIDTEAQRFPFLPRFAQMNVRANPAVNPQGDPNARGWIYTALAATEQAIINLTSRKVTTASVNGQSYSIQDVEKLWRMVRKYQDEIRRIEQTERLSAGLGASKNILVRFSKPLPVAGPFPWGAGPWPP